MRKKNQLSNAWRSHLRIPESVSCSEGLGFAGRSTGTTKYAAPLIATVFVIFSAVLSITTGTARASDYGRMAGTVLDAQGNPLMGATVLIVGPVLAGANSFQPGVERILTDAQGKFDAERLMPGWYSLRVTSAARLPTLRNGVRVQAGHTALEKFVLSDIFLPLHFQAPAGNVSSWGDDWKWVLRTSASTRPILRYRQQPAVHAQSFKPPLPHSQRLIGMTPGGTRREALEGNQNLGSVLAYLRPLSEDADLLVAGAMTADGSQASSLATAIRKHIMKDDPEELTLVIHQLDFGEAMPVIAGGIRQGLNQAQAVSASYSNTRRLSDALTLKAGMEIDYLNAASSAMIADPNISIEYHRPNSPDSVTLRFGAASAEGSSTLLERVGALNAFPRVTLQNNRPQLEKLTHSEVNFSHTLSKSSRAEIAAYRDNFENTAVWGMGNANALGWLAGGVLPNSAVNGVTLNGGNYGSTGIRVLYIVSVGNHVDAAVVYASGNALTVKNAGIDVFAPGSNLREVLSNDRSQSVAGKISARIPASKTQIITSYQWIQRGRVTGVDPSGQASMQLQPFLGLQIRQPLPALAFLPARIEALADFRNLMAQGYIPLARTGDRLVLTPAYRSFRGGFSVQF